MPPPPKERRKLNDFSAVLAKSIQVFKYSCWIHCLIETITLVLPVLSQKSNQSSTITWATNAFFEGFLHSASEENKAIFFPPLRVLGALFVLSGSTIRYLCYRELGRHFTFQVALLDDHFLITTGPYGIVRHPSYIGGMTMNIGMLMWHATPGSWLLQSKFYTKPVAWLGIIPTLFSLSMLISIEILRPRMEDEMLKKEFGKKWDEWASRVPYRLVPGVY
ncbi:hypothetical protein BDN70DRAFT_933264 [Pholiota conissans]|uniref:Protein-S-isoprenylcysteine O-methyltransferase n=1 Tax=Pholiota conissans TaxID=109636 RepID=A0A9P6CZR1_9AGAR|nr:hypothetical protein BDN70DRAFT_933264 [Pholiota conissans]